MTTINNLPLLPTLRTSDQFVVWAPNQGDSRRVPYNAIKMDILDSFNSDIAATVMTFSNKTFNLVDNNLTGTLGQFNAACSDADFASTATAQTLTNKTMALGSNNLTTIATGTGAVSRTVQAKLADAVSVKDFGAVGDGVTDDTGAFSSAAASSAQVFVPSGAYLLNSNPNASTFIVQDGATFSGAGNLNTVTGHVVSYVGAFRSLESDASFYAGIFGYLEQNAAINGYGTIGVHGFARSIGGGGASGEADIAVAGCAVHDLPASNGGVWALYGTAVRQAGVNGATHPLELDIANMGSEVPVFPHAMFPAGSTPCAWICTGGEITASGAGSPGVASCAIGIVQNDSQVVKTAFYEKGIVFHNTSIKGADGTGGAAIGVAVAFASGHAMQWYNNSGQVVSELVCTGVGQSGNNYRLDFSDFGLLLQDRASGATVFQIEKTANGVNGLGVRPGATGVPGELLAIGSDTNIDLQLRPKGGGLVKFGALTATTDAPITGYVEVKTNDGTTRRLAVIG
jgi:ribosomal protein S11